ncbi:MAG: DUF2029 domain-containing protein [Chloroflexi bacterium]|nr:DUF2029 domain-containing protein [Chloroflexota bacterium]
MTRIAIVLLIAASGVAAAAGNDDYRSYDFACFWTGGRFVLEGRDLYDRAAWEQATRATAARPAASGLVADPCPGTFGYPLWTALALAPLGALPITPAAAIWMSLNIAGALAGLVLCWRAARGPRRAALLYATVVVFSLPFWRMLVLGQMSGILLGLAGASAYLSGRGDERHGVALGAMILKPQVAAIFGAIALLRAVRSQRWRGIALASTVALLLAGASLAYDATWPVRWLSEVLGHRADMVRGLPSVWGLAGELGEPLLALPVLLLLGAAAWWLVRGSPIDDGRRAALLLPLGALVVPYFQSYDHLLLALPWAYIARDAAALLPLARATALAGLVVCASVLPWVLYAAAFPGRDSWNALTPALTVLLLAATTRVTR